MDKTWLDMQVEKRMIPKGRGVKQPVKDKGKDHVSERGVKQPVKDKGNKKVIDSPCEIGSQELVLRRSPSLTKTFH